MDKAEGDKVELDKVLLIADDKKVTVGAPTIEGAKVNGYFKRSDQKARKSSFSDSRRKTIIPRRPVIAPNIPANYR